MVVSMERKPGFLLFHKHQPGLLPTILSKPSMIVPSKIIPEVRLPNMMLNKCFCFDKEIDQNYRTTVIKLLW